MHCRRQTSQIPDEHFWQTALGDVTKGGTLVGFFALVPCLTDMLSDVHFCCVFFSICFCRMLPYGGPNALLSDDSTRLLKNQYRDAAPWEKKRSGNERAGKRMTVKQNQQREQTEAKFSEQSEYRREG